MKKAALFIVVLALVAGCAAMGNGKPFADLSHKQRAGIIASVWVQQYDAYLFAQDAPLTEGQKKVMRVKREILVKMKPLIEAYAVYAKKGMIPPAVLTEKLFPLFTELTTLMAKEI